MKGGGPAPNLPAQRGPSVQFPQSSRSPLSVLAQRLGLAVGLLVLVAVIAYVLRDGYRDADEDPVSFLDALYYASVTVTTTGYGDITPVSDGARLATTILITPIRIMFLILLVGTTVELLAERSRAAIRESLWRRKLKDHVIICGFGTKGRAAAEALVGKGATPEQIVVIDPDASAREVATDAGHTAIAGDAATSALLRHAGIQDARAVVVATHRDDTSVLATLTARELNPSVVISAAVREEENAHLLRQSGANSVITSSSAAGRLLGIATHAPQSVEVIEDLLKIGIGLDLEERTIEAGEGGPAEEVIAPNRLVGVVRADEVLHFDDPRCSVLQPGDKVVYLRSHAEKMKASDSGANANPA